MKPCLFASDLHGKTGRYSRLFESIESMRPAAVLLGGDLLPGPLAELARPPGGHVDFIKDVMAAGLERLRGRLGQDYPRVFLILGNDDSRFYESSVLSVATEGLWDYAHDRRLRFGSFTVYGYSYVPPTPFMLKDWERYDVSRFVDPGCVSPEEGRRTVPVTEDEARYETIREDLERLAGDDEMGRAILLFHTPPYRTNLDRAALDGKKVDHVPLDVNVGSIAVRRFLKARQPLLSLHGHVHESARLTGSWQDRLGHTTLFSAAHDGPELALVRFDLEDLEQASRELVPVDEVAP